MKPKYVAFDDQLYSYLCRHRSHLNDPILEDLRKETELLGEDAKMQIGPEQGSFMSILVAALGVRSAIEVGTFTGYSAICIARGLGEGGRLICIDENQAWLSIAQRYWARAGVEKKIDLHLGSAIPLLEKLHPRISFDFVFIDADKTEYDAYYELLLPRVRTHGLILFDNMLWGGKVTDRPLEHPSGQAIDRLNKKLSNDPRIETVLLPIADGIQLCRKRA